MLHFKIAFFLKAFSSMVYFLLPDSLFDSQEGTLDSNLYGALVVFDLETHK